MASRKNGVLYVGATSNLKQRVRQHKEGVIDGFTKKYFVKKLVYYEELPSMMEAIEREKSIKGLLRLKKILLIHTRNPHWNDLYYEI